MINIWFGFSLCGNTVSIFIIIGHTLLAPKTVPFYLLMHLISDSFCLLLLSLCWQTPPFASIHHNRVRFSLLVCPQNSYCLYTELCKLMSNCGQKIALDTTTLHSLCLNLGVETCFQQEKHLLNAHNYADFQLNHTVTQPKRKSTTVERWRRVVLCWLDLNRTWTPLNDCRQTGRKGRTRVAFILAFGVNCRGVRLLRVMLMLEHRWLPVDWDDDGEEVVDKVCCHQ